ncbi:MAG: amidohydrolase [Dehalococcoidia bacterium]|nr:amidohydrolase [Dehalococcoidia bacterium]
MPIYADTIISARQIITMDLSDSIVTSVAIKDGVILAVGTDLQSMQGPDTATHSFLDCTVFPGFIEPHTHPDLCAQMYSWVDISGFSHQTSVEVMNALRKSISKVPNGEWIFAFGYDPVIFPDLTGLTRDQLDQIAPENPIAVMTQSMHTLFVNSLAFSEAGIDESSEPARFGGEYVRDQTGRLTGKIEESPAMRPFLRFFDDSVKTRSNNLSKQYDRYRSVGITTIGSAGLFFRDEETVALYENETKADRLRIRNAVYLRHMDIDNHNLPKFSSNNMFGISGVKLWYDGSPYTGTMLLDQPYLNSELTTEGLGIATNSTGRANWELDDFYQLVNGLHDRGVQILVHAQGDRATREVLDTFERVLKNSPNKVHRHRIEHSALMEKDEISRAADLGISISFHMNHIKYYGQRLRDEIIGYERSQYLMPARTAQEAGIRISLHADSPMFPPNPLDLVQTAVTRMAVTGEVINEPEKLDLKDALRAVTIDAAWQLGIDDQIGSLEIGKLADFTILGQDPFHVNPNQLNAIPIIDTWLSGASTSHLI